MVHMSHLRKAFQINKFLFPPIQHRNLQQYSCNISNVIVILLERCNVATILLKWSVLYVLHYSSPYVSFIRSSVFLSTIHYKYNSKFTTSISDPLVSFVAWLNGRKSERSTSSILQFLRIRPPQCGHQGHRKILQGACHTDSLEQQMYPEWVPVTMGVTTTGAYNDNLVRQHNDVSLNPHWRKCTHSWRRHKPEA